MQTKTDALVVRASTAQIVVQSAVDSHAIRVHSTLRATDASSVRSFFVLPYDRLPLMIHVRRLFVTTGENLTQN